MRRDLDVRLLTNVKVELPHRDRSYVDFVEHRFDVRSPSLAHSRIRLILGGLKLVFLVQVAQVRVANRRVGQFVGRVVDLHLGRLVVLASLHLYH